MRGRWYFAVPIGLLLLQLGMLVFGAAQLPSECSTLVCGAVLIVMVLLTNPIAIGATAVITLLALSKSRARGENVSEVGHSVARGAAIGMLVAALIVIVAVVVLAAAFTYSDFKEARRWELARGIGNCV